MYHKEDGQECEFVLIKSDQTEIKLQSGLGYSPLPPLLPQRKLIALVFAIVPALSWVIIMKYVHKNSYRTMKTF